MFPMLSTRKARREKSALCREERRTIKNPSLFIEQKASPASSFLKESVSQIRRAMMNNSNNLLKLEESGAPFHLVESGNRANLIGTEILTTIGIMKSFRCEAEDWCLSAIHGVPHARSTRLLRVEQEAFSVLKLSLVSKSSECSKTYNACKVVQGLWLLHFRKTRASLWI